jgi:hypothetical protein
MNAMNGHYGASWGTADSGSGLLANVSKLKTLFRCPDAPNYATDNAANSASVDYMCNPRIMPDVWNSGFKPNPASVQPGQGELTAPYPIASVKNPSQIAVVFDGSLNWSTGYQSWAAGGGNQDPVADTIDWGGGGGMFGPLHMLAILSDSRFDANDSISMMPIGGALYVNQDSMIDPDTNTHTNEQNIRFRHLRDTTANALMADQHVESFRYDKTKAPNDPRVTTLLKKNIYVNAWGPDAYVAP